MTEEVKKDLLKRLEHDNAFKESVKANPTAALAGFDLTPDEIAIITAKGMSSDTLSQPNAG